ncbi:MAG: nuclear transport factor 2 family protein [Gemmatimonadaceae bacterium]|jgi:ketosteroid isomerase-like protein
MLRHAEADEHEVHAVAESLRNAVNRGDVAAILACWSPRGVLQPPHHPAVCGHQAIAEYFRNILATRRLTFTFTESVVIVLDEVALETLSYTAVATTLAGTGRTDDVGKGLHVYGRQPDGSWKLTQDIWNSDLPLTRPTDLNEK